MKVTSCESILKYLWIFFYLFSILGLSFYVREIFIKFKFEPDIMVRENVVPIWKVPFSAISICTPLLAKKKNIDLNSLYVDSSRYNGSQSQKCFVPLMGSCYTEKIPKNVSDISYDSLDECLPTFNETILPDCVIPVRCSENQAQPFITHKKCFTFNILKNLTLNKFYVLQNESKTLQNWSLSDGYVNDEVKYPFRFHKSNRIAFHLLFDEEDRSNICFKYGGTYKVMFHLPNEVPMWDFSVTSINCRIGTFKIHKH